MSLFDDVKRTLPKSQFSASSRYSDGVEHHPEALRIMEFLMDYDYKEMCDSLGWKVGGDGDSGENLLCALSVYFEYQDSFWVEVGEVTEGFIVPVSKTGDG